MRLLHLISWQYARRHVLRTALTVAGIVLGVAVFVAMHTANQNVLLAFSQTIDRIAGRTELQVTAGEAGFGEDVLEKVQSASTVRIAVPVIEAVAESGLARQGTLLVLGVDMTGDRRLREYDLESGQDAIIDDPLVFLAQPDSLIVSKDLADKHHLAVGSRLPLQTALGERPFTIRGIMEPTGLATAFGGSLVIMDVYAAQKMFGRGRTFDRIDLALAPGVTVADAERELTVLLGPGFEIQPPATRGRQAETMLAGYAVMVSISSAFALFVGMFIIYNSFAIAVTQRRSEIGILRALGATRRQIRWLFLGESAALGTIGSVAGLGLGLLIAHATAATLSGLAADLYGVAQQASEVTARPVVLALAVVIGVATSVVAVVIPARNAANVDPVHALQKGRFQVVSVRESRARIRLASVAAGLSIACSFATERRPVFYAG
ncbi:MAG TPA: FtsX-like permease family protein, partial [Vicinamibacterales bacterium]|nr:FtsX-like permease family protein [Vicinamibacterales bacterium]